MTDDFDTEIRSTLAAMVAEAPDPLSFDDLALQAVAPTQPRTRWFPGKAFAASFVAVVIAVGAVALLVGSFDGGTDPADAVPTTATTLPPETLAPTIWSRIPHDADVFGDAEMVSVVAGGPGLVAVGSASSNPGAPAVDGDAAVWTSTDGIVWSRVPHDEAVFGGEGNQWMGSVIVGGPGLLAFGEEVFGEDEGGGVRAAVWTSVDGLSWSRVSQDETLYPGVGPDGVVAGGPGFVTIDEADGGSAVWTSSDGFAWSRVPHDEAVFGLRLGYGNAMQGVTVGGPGLVAVGSDGLNSDEPTGRARAVVWTSIDGLTWSRLPHNEAVFGGEGDQGMFDVTAGGPGLVAVGENDHGAPVWTSADGITWSQVPNDESVFSGPDTRIHDVMTAGPGLVAFGENGYGYRTPVMWTSRDGITWSQVPNDESVFSGPDTRINDVMTGGPGLVAVGSDGHDAAVWISLLDN
jgi:hypothetical protein